MTRFGQAARRHSPAMVASLAAVTSVLAGAGASSSAAPRDFPLPKGSQPTDVVYDGARSLWVSAYGSNTLIRVTAKSGKRKTFALRPTDFASGHVESVYRGPKGHVYFRQELGSVVGDMNVANGQRRYYSAPNQYFQGAFGHQGRLWLDGGRLVGFKPSGASAIGIACDGVTSNKSYVWCAKENSRLVVRFKVVDGQLQNRSFRVPLRSALDIDELAVGPKGSVWFAASVDHSIHGVVGRILPGGAVKSWRIRADWANSRGRNLTAGPGGWMYYSVGGRRLVRINTAGKQQVARLGKRNVEAAAFDGAGRLWTIDFGRSRITRSLPKQIF